MRTELSVWNMIAITVSHDPPIEWDQLWCGVFVSLHKVLRMP